MTPVFNRSPGTRAPCGRVSRNELRTARESMSGDRRIDFLDSSTAAFETGFDAAVRLADGIRPLRPRNLSTKSKRDCWAFRRLDRGKRSIPNAISAMTG